MNSSKNNAEKLFQKKKIENSNDDLIDNEIPEIIRCKIYNKLFYFFYLSIKV